MTRPVAALLLGSIGTLADTSEVQRESFNAAFAEHGLDWRWDRDDYAEMLRGSGGEQRIAEQARATGASVDAAAVHRSKSEHFQRRLAAGVTPRPGVVEVIAAAHAQGTPVALVTTTSPENVTALLGGLAGHVAPTDLALVVDTGSVPARKPDPAAYRYALERLGVAAEDCVAVEDNTGGVAAAVAAGVPCVAFPNENTAGHDFGDAARVVAALEPAEVLQRG